MLVVVICCCCQENIAIYQLCNSGVGYLEIELFLFMFVITEIGKTVGYHRYFAHKAFKAKQAVRVILAILGSMAGQGPIIASVSVHRCHHQYTDLPGDPHSPHLHGESILGRLKGLWHSHIGWLLNSELPNSLIYAKDLLSDSLLRQVNRLYVMWIFVGLIIPAILGGVFTWTWEGAFQGFIWGGLARLFINVNSGYAINSIGHVYGRHLLNTNDQSKNNIWLAIPTLGEAWHNNHHAFPNSAKFGLKWWQVDLGYWVIRALEIVGLAWDVKAPTVEMIEAKNVAEGA